MSASETRYAQRLVALQTEADAIDASLRAMDCVEPYVRSVGLSGDGPRAAAAKPSAPSDALPEFSARDQRQLEQEVLRSAHIVFCTLSGAGEALRLAEVDGGFETAIFDEAAQAAELSTLIPLQ